MVQNIKQSPKLGFWVLDINIFDGFLRTFYFIFGVKAKIPWLFDSELPGETLNS